LTAAVLAASSSDTAPAAAVAAPSSAPHPATPAADAGEFVSAAEAARAPAPPVAKSKGRGRKARGQSGLSGFVPAAVSDALDAVPPRAVRVGVGLGVTLAIVTFAVACVRVALKYRAPENRRARTVGRNRLVVDGVGGYLPGSRDKLTPKVAKTLCKKSGFTATEVFRKYLWYLLQERNGVGGGPRGSRCRCRCRGRRRPLLSSITLSFPLSNLRSSAPPSPTTHTHAGASL